MFDYTVVMNNYSESQKNNRRTYNGGKLTGDNLH